jgi:hypothetical protein
VNTHPSQACGLPKQQQITTYLHRDCHSDSQLPPLKAKILNHLQGIPSNTIDFDIIPDSEEECHTHNYSQKMTGNDNDNTSVTDNDESAGSDNGQRQSSEAPAEDTDSDLNLELDPTALAEFELDPYANDIFSDHNRHGML